MHISYKAEVLLVPRGLAYRLPPFLYELQYPVLHAGGMDGRTFGKAADELIEEFLGADLEVEGVSAVLDAYVEELCRSQQVISDNSHTVVRLAQVRQRSGCGG